MGIKVFISYAKEDIDTAQRLYNDLRKEGVEPWLDRANLLAGQNWKDEIPRIIKESDYFLFLISLHSDSKTGFVQKELKDALEKFKQFPKNKIFIIPVKLDNTNPLDDTLQNLHWVDLYSSYEKGLKQILRVVMPTDNCREIIETIGNDTIITWEHIDNAFKKLKPEIMKYKPDAIVGLADGRIIGAIIAANCNVDYFYAIDIPKSGKHKDTVLGNIGDLKNKKVLLVDNHIYSGSNWSIANSVINKKSPAQIKRLVFFKHDISKSVEVDYCAYIIEGKRRIMPWAYTKDHSERYNVE